MKGAEIFIVTTLFSWLLGFPVRKLLVRWNIIDRPNARSSHIEPVARGGGLGILFAVVAMVAIAVPVEERVVAWLASGIGVAVISFVDDLRPQPAWLRFGCHLAGAALILWALGFPLLRVGFTAESGWWMPLVLSAAVALFFFVGHTNAFNFMDGINGIAAGQAAVTGAGMALLAGLASGKWNSAPELLCWVIAGAGAGFLPHNFPRARMFMGDVSSAPLGLLLAALVVWLAAEHGAWLLLPLGLMHANFLLDTAITLVRRVSRGERWHEAHREHFYQRLIRSGKSHAFVTGAEMGLQLLTFGLLAGYVRAESGLRPWLAAGVVGLWLGFFGWAEAEFRRAQTAQA